MARRTLTLSELPALLDAMGQVTGRSASIGVTDPAVGRYARVLEYGSIAGQKPWPQPGAKTVLARNPDTGAAVVVTAQAPQGYIRVNAPTFLLELNNRIAGSADWLDPEETADHLERATAAAAAAALNRLRQLIPQESGRLRESLRVLDG